MNRWDHLKTFLAVARAGTLTAAAEAMQVGAATLHRHLASLEEAFGAPLFDKGPRGYRLTHVGEALLPRAEEVEEAIFAATRTVAGHDQQASGEVRLTLPPLLLTVLAPHLATFRKHHPRIGLILQADDSRLDLKRDTDLAFRATVAPIDSAIGRKLCNVAWARYASAHTEGDALPWIHYRGLARSPAVAWRKKTYPTATPVMQVESVIGMLWVLPPSGAQGLLPCFAGDGATGLRRLGSPVAASELWLLVHADLRRSARVRAVIDFFVPRLQAHRGAFESGTVA